jgi:hypothetical protein
MLREKGRQTMLKGYKTYIVAGISIIGAVGGYAVGDVTLANMIQLCVTALLGATIRNAFS